MRKKLLTIILVSFMVFICTACSEETPDVNTDGTMLNLTFEDIEMQQMSGFFVMNHDDTFTPVMSRAQGYAGELADASGENLAARYLWFHDNDLEISSLIPTIKNGDKLVFIYDSTDEFPETFSLEKYDYKGYTLGCHIYRDADNSLYLSMDGLLSGSSAHASLSQLEGDAYKISEINGTSKLPTANVDNNMQMLLGLEKGKYYDFEFYKGTKYISFQTIADTLVFQSTSFANLKNPYSRTQDGYFYINLPDNLQKGYYYICGEGLFRYDG